MMLLESFPQRLTVFVWGRVLTDKQLLPPTTSIWVMGWICDCNHNVWTYHWVKIIKLKFLIEMGNIDDYTLFVFDLTLFESLDSKDPNTISLLEYYLIVLLLRKGAFHKNI